MKVSRVAWQFHKFVYRMIQKPWSPSLTFTGQQDKLWLNRSLMIGQEKQRGQINSKNNWFYDVIQTSLRMQKGLIYVGICLWLGQKYIDSYWVDYGLDLIPTLYWRTKHKAITLKSCAFGFNSFWREHIGLYTNFIKTKLHPTSQCFGLGFIFDYCSNISFHHATKYQVFLLFFFGSQPLSSLPSHDFGFNPLIYLSRLL